MIEIAPERRPPGAEPAKLGSVGETLRAWEAAWNAKDMVACIRCYSLANPFRRAWEEKDEPVYGKMAEDLRTFPGRMRLLEPQVTTTGDEARVLGRISVEVPGASHHVLPLKMVFQLEDGVWLILEDGVSSAP